MFLRCGSSLEAFREETRQCVSSRHVEESGSGLRTNCVLQDHVLIELTQAGLKGSSEGSESYEEDPYLVVNPNYLLED